MRKITAFIRGRRLIIFLLVSAAFIRGRRLFEGGVYSSNYGMQRTSLVVGVYCNLHIKATSISRRLR